MGALNNFSCLCLNQKGQAAVTDALYLLLIVSALCVFLFTFSIAYGNSVSAYIERQYASDFSSSALKTILYSNVPRAPNAVLGEDTEEVDHLLTMIKQDYASDEKLSENSQKILGNTVKAVMKPVSATHDYFFFISIPNERKPVFGYLYKTRFPEEFECLAQKKQKVEFPAGQAHEEFYCMPEPKTLQGLGEVIGEAAQTTASINLVTIGATGLETVDARVTLVMWIGTCLPEELMKEMNCQRIE